MTFHEMLKAIEEQIAGTSAMGGPAKKTEFMPLTNIADPIKRKKKGQKLVRKSRPAGMTSRYISLEPESVLAGSAIQQRVSASSNKRPNIRVNKHA